MADNNLPENAYRELKEGEAYRPIVPAESSMLEVTVRSVLFGLFMGLAVSPFKQSGDTIAAPVQDAP